MTTQIMFRQCPPYKCARNKIILVLLIRNSLVDEYELSPFLCYTVVCHRIICSICTKAYLSSKMLRNAHSIISAVPLLCAAALLSLVACRSSTNTFAFVRDCRNCRQRSQSTRVKEGDGTDPDLFDYFDPLMSPHAYPSGISPDQKPEFDINKKIEQERRLERTQSSELKEFGFRLAVTEEDLTTSSASTNEVNSDEKKEENLLDYFDPLRSPHAYPDGIKSKQESMSSMKTPPPDLEIVEDESSHTSSSINAISSNSNGKKKKVGVLLMDHGSRKEKSNARLQAMAKLYQLTLESNEDENNEDTATEIIVRAAHMEIAAPSIPDKLKELKDLGVDEIICHPFFLSADGRHVKEDIPQIIGDAIEDLWGEKSGAKKIPIVTTAPVGSNTQLMLGAIHSLVRENSQYLTTLV